MVSFKHHFTSAKADGGDSTLVKPSDWNAPHDVVAAADGVVLGVPAGAGASQPVQEMPISSVFPAGFVTVFAGATAPAGWLICDGALYARADYPALFTAVGTAYNIGGEATTQFRVPDCRGRVIVGLDAGAGRLPGWVLGTAGGSMNRQPRVYGGVSASTGLFNLRLDGSASANATAGGGSGAGPMCGDGAFVSVNGNVNFGVSGGIVDNGANTTAGFDVVQPTIAMNQMIKT